MVKKQRSISEKRDLPKFKEGGWMISHRKIGYSKKRVDSMEFRTKFLSWTNFQQKFFIEAMKYIHNRRR